MEGERDLLFFGQVTREEGRQLDDIYLAYGL